MKLCNKIETPYIYHHSLLILMLIVLQVSITDTTCIFDQIKQKDTIQGHTKYATGFDTGREKRSSGNSDSIENKYREIRIYTDYHNLDSELSSNEKTRLKTVIRSAVVKSCGIFSVIPVEGPLLLSRSKAACRVFADGINKGKCAFPSRSYSGEICGDNFQIPDKHLEGLFQYDSTHPEPIKTLYSQGKGQDQADIILYITAKSTNECLNSGNKVIAYASYCQLDQFNRPIAGYINVCPHSLQDGDYNEEKVKVAALHEMFHVLGFSKNLYEKFSDCSASDDHLECKPHHRPVRTVNGAVRLVTPKLQQLASKHFDCKSTSSIHEFGPILQTNQDGNPLSHWDSASMQGSLMSANLGQAHLTILDMMTLALFEDSGWYRVNYLYAQNYLWGKGGGCSFGLGSECKNNTEYFCSGSGAGCHYLHKDKGHCDTDNFLHGCRLFQSKSSDSCLDTSTSPQIDSQFSEMFGSKSRCFLTNFTTVPSVEGSRLNGKCYEHRCNDTNHLEVKIGTGDWTFCPFGETVEIADTNSILQCPKEGVLCNDPMVTTTTTQSTTTKYIIPTAEPSDGSTIKFPSDIVCIEVVFPTANFNKLQQKMMLDLFKEKVNNIIVQLTAIHQRRLSNTKVIKGSVVYAVDLLPPSYVDDGPSSQLIYQKIQDKVIAGNFTIEISETEKYTAGAIRTLPAGPTVNIEEDRTGIIAGVVIGSILAAVVMGILVYFVQRHYALHTRRRPRTSVNNNRVEQNEGSPSIPIGTVSGAISQGEEPTNSQQNYRHSGDLVVTEIPIEIRSEFSDCSSDCSSFGNTL